MSWTDERVDLLKKLWSEGLSASQIAMRLGTVTRNAVIGKVHRLGLAGRATTTRMKPARAPGRAVPPNVKRPPQRQRPALVASAAMPGLAFEPVYEAPPVEREEVYIPPHERKTVLDLQDCHCRWPIGDPQMHDFHFCGRPKVPGLPYCETHARRAFQPDMPRRRDRAAGSYPPAGDRVPTMAEPFAPAGIRAHSPTTPRGDGEDS